MFFTVGCQTIKQKTDLIVQKENELQNILIDEIKTQNSNPLG